MKDLIIVLGGLLAFCALVIAAGMWASIANQELHGRRNPNDGRHMLRETARRALGDV